MSTDFFSLIMIAMALYVLVGGITGKGKLYAVDGVPEEKQPKFKKWLRIIYLVMGLFMALNTGLSYMRDQMYTYVPVAVEQTTPEEAEAAELATEAEQNAAEAETAPAETAEAAEPAAEAAEIATETEAAPAETAEAAEAAAPDDVSALTPAEGPEREGYVFVRTEKLPGIKLSYKTMNVLAFIMLGITMAAVIAMFIVINKFIDKEAARKAQEEKAAKSGNGGRNGGSTMPRDAFEFDDEPEEPAEKKEN